MNFARQIPNALNDEHRALLELLNRIETNFGARTGRAALVVGP